jgi:exonuclease III
VTPSRLRGTVAQEPYSNAIVWRHHVCAETFFTGQCLATPMRHPTKGWHVTICYTWHVLSCRSRPVHGDGIGFLLSKIAKRSLIEWHPISERILTAHFKGNIWNVTVIKFYAPTEGTQTDKKQAYYLQLSRAVMDSNKRDIKIVM